MKEDAEEGPDGIAGLENDTKYLSIDDITNEDLKNWLSSLGRYLRDNLLITELGDSFGWSIKLYTRTYVYSIRARPNEYLGATVSCRMPRAGESHRRGSDLADGKFCFGTWHNILCDIIAYEKVPLEITTPNRINCSSSIEGDKNFKNKYTQLKVATQDLLIELGFSPQTLKEFIDGTAGQNNQPSDKVCQKLIDAGILDK